MSNTKIVLEPSEIDELANALIGTCLTFDEVCEEMFNCSSMQLSHETLAHFDALAFECAECGWWYETPSHLHEDDQLCDSCYGDR